jgi:hypothetical protein
MDRLLDKEIVKSEMLHGFFPLYLFLSSILPLDNVSRKGLIREFRHCAELMEDIR